MNTSYFSVMLVFPQVAQSQPLRNALAANDTLGFIQDVFPLYIIYRHC